MDKRLFKTVIFCRGYSYIYVIVIIIFLVFIFQTLPLVCLNNFLSTLLCILINGSK